MIAGVVFLFGSAALATETNESESVCANHAAEKRKLAEQIEMMNTELNAIINELQSMRLEYLKSRVGRMITELGDDEFIPVLGDRPD